MMKHVTSCAPKWGKYGTNVGRISKVSQHHQVTYQLCIQWHWIRRKKQNVIYFTRHYLHMTKHVRCYTPKMGKYGTNWGKFEISNMSQHHQDRYQITLLVTLNQKTHTECKLVNDMYYFDCTNLFTFRDQSERVTRGNKKKLFKHRAGLDVRKYSFSNRVANLWNSLLDSVISAETVFCFETRLDNHWKDQDILYEYEFEWIWIWIWINFKLQGNSQDEELVL